jgi:RNA polymerase sigma-70 factor, ECF subfamily
MDASPLTMKPRTMTPHLTFSTRGHEDTHADPGRLSATDDDRELVRRMRAGDERAFDEFADHYIPALYRFASSRLGTERELARDIVSATVCKVIEKLDSYRGDASLFTWLCACCRNEIAGHFRKAQGKQSVGLELADELPLASGSTPAGPEQVLLDEESASLVHRTLDHLSPRYAAALQWRYLDGLSVQEIAQRLTLGMKATESVLSRAREAFREAHTQLAGMRITGTMRQQS